MLYALLFSMAALQPSVCPPPPILPFRQRTREKGILTCSVRPAQPPTHFLPTISHVKNRWRQPQRQPASMMRSLPCPRATTHW